MQNVDLNLKEISLHPFHIILSLSLTSHNLNTIYNWAVQNNMFFYI